MTYNIESIKKAVYIQLSPGAVSNEEYMQAYKYIQSFKSRAENLFMYLELLKQDDAQLRLLGINSVRSIVANKQWDTLSESIRQQAFKVIIDSFLLLLRATDGAETPMTLSFLSSIAMLTSVEPSIVKDELCNMLKIISDSKYEAHSLYVVAQLLANVSEMGRFFRSKKFLVDIINMFVPFVEGTLQRMFGNKELPPPASNSLKYSLEIIEIVADVGMYYATIGKYVPVLQELLISDIPIDMKHTVIRSLEFILRRFPSKCPEKTAYIVEIANFLQASWPKDPTKKNMHVLVSMTFDAHDNEIHEFYTHLIKFLSYCIMTPMTPLLMSNNPQLTAFVEMFALFIEHPSPIIFNETLNWWQTVFTNEPKWNPDGTNQFYVTFLSRCYSFLLRFTNKPSSPLIFPVCQDSKTMYFLNMNIDTDEQIYNFMVSLRAMIKQVVKIVAQNHPLESLQLTANLVCSNLQKVVNDTTACVFLEAAELLFGAVAEGLVLISTTISISNSMSTHPNTKASQYKDPFNNTNVVNKILEVLESLLKFNCKNVAEYLTITIGLASFENIMGIPAMAFRTPAYLNGLIEHVAWPKSTKNLMRTANSISPTGEPTFGLPDEIMSSRRRTVDTLVSISKNKGICKNVSGQINALYTLLGSLIAQGVFTEQEEARITSIFIMFSQELPIEQKKEVLNVLLAGKISILVHPNIQRALSSESQFVEFFNISCISGASGQMSNVSIASEIWARRRTFSFSLETICAVIEGFMATKGKTSTSLLGDVYDKLIPFTTLLITLIEGLITKHSELVFEYVSAVYTPPQMANSKNLLEKPQIDSDAAFMAKWLFSIRERIYKILAFGYTDGYLLGTISKTVSLTSFVTMLSNALIAAPLPLSPALLSGAVNPVLQYEQGVVCHKLLVDILPVFAEKLRAAWNCIQQSPSAPATKFDLLSQLDRNVLMDEKTCEGMLECVSKAFTSSVIILFGPSDRKSGKHPAEKQPLSENKTMLFIFSASERLAAFLAIVASLLYTNSGKMIKIVANGIFTNVLSNLIGLSSGPIVQQPSVLEGIIGLFDALCFVLYQEEITQSNQNTLLSASNGKGELFVASYCIGELYCLTPALGILEAARKVLTKYISVARVQEFELKLGAIATPTEKKRIYRLLITYNTD